MANPAPGFSRHPDHTIRIEPLGKSVEIRFGGAVIARSDNALMLHEAKYPPVIYVPLSDVSDEHIERTASQTHCPFKGDASYWTLTANGKEANDAMWAYEAPFDETSAIKNHAAFYPDKVEIEVA